MTIQKVTSYNPAFSSSSLFIFDSRVLPEYIESKFMPDSD